MIMEPAGILVVDDLSRVFVVRVLIGQNYFIAIFVGNAPHLLAFPGIASAAGARGSMALRSSFIVWLRYIAVRLCCQGRVLLRGSTLVLAAMENSSGSPKAFLENGQPPVGVGRLPVSARELAAGAAISLTLVPLLVIIAYLMLRVAHRAEVT